MPNALKKRLPKFLQSDTILWNLLSFITLLIASAVGTEWMKENPDILQILLGVQAMINIALRYKTKTPVGEQSRWG